MQLTIEVGEKIESFDSKQDWVNRAQRVFTRMGLTSGSDHLCISQAGRVCKLGMDFMAAEKHGEYPVDVYLIHSRTRSALMINQPSAASPEMAIADPNAGGGEVVLLP